MPTSSSAGKPASSPVDASKLAQSGAFSTVKISVSPSRSDAVGMNAYSVPAATVPGGSPEIEGAVLTVARRTVISNGGSVVVARPSVTAITTSRYRPALACGGTPSSSPVSASNDAHGGRLLIVNESGSPSASEACGTKRYVSPARTDGEGVPAIVGAAFGADPDGGDTTISNGGSSVSVSPSVTQTTMPRYAPTSSGPRHPVNSTEGESNSAHGGRPSTPNSRASPSGSLASGLNAYSEPARTAVCGAPLSAGGVFPAPSPTWAWVSSSSPPHPAKTSAPDNTMRKRRHRAAAVPGSTILILSSRSEERRVGKECRARWARCDVERSAEHRN